MTPPRGRGGAPGGGHASAASRPVGAAGGATVVNVPGARPRPTIASTLRLVEPDKPTIAGSIRMTEPDKPTIAAASIRMREP